MAVTDHASAAAAVTAGWKKTQIDRGASTGAPNLNAAQPLRFITRFEKPLTGAASGLDGGWKACIEGESSVDAATADTNATNALNAWRRHYYAGSPGRASGSAESSPMRGGNHTADTT